MRPPCARYSERLAQGVLSCLSEIPLRFHFTWRSSFHALPAMPKPSLPKRASVASRWLRGDCSRTSMQIASRIEVFPWALSPVRMAPASGASRSSDSKHLKSINRSDRITGVFLTPKFTCGKRAIDTGGQIVFFAGNFPARSFFVWLADFGVDLFSRSKPVADAALSVTQLLRRMKLVLEGEIGELWVEGEVSNLKKQGSGHWYFSLKDEGAQIQCVMFSAARREGSAALVDGAKVRVFAEASVYEARGQLQVIVKQVERAGAGDLQAKFEQLKRRLQEEGLFDAERKKPLPFFPRVVGLVTSESGAALQDMLNVLSRRAPWVKAVLYPVRVQGKGAEIEIARAIERMGRPVDYGLPRCEVLIVRRGGG